MFEALLAFGKELIAHYGLAGLFILSFFTSLIIVPVPIDLFIIGAIAGGLSPLWSGVLAAIGTTLGAGVDFYLGYLGSKFISSRFGHKDFHRASDWIKKYGSAAIFLCSLLPVPYDIVAIAAGAGKMNILHFFLFTLPGKIMKYLFIAYAYVGGVHLLSHRADLETEFKILGILIIVIVLIYYLRSNTLNHSLDEK